MIQNNQNLQWLMDPGYQMEGCWLTIKPSPTAWKTIEKVQDFVARELGKEKINNWAPYPLDLAHISVFVGLNEKVTKEEKLAIMRRVQEKVSCIPNFNVQFNLSDATIQRGPGKHVTLHFNSPQIVNLNEKIREAFIEAISANELDVDHTSLDKLGQGISPHLTIGVIDVIDSKDIPWSQKHKDMRGFLNKTNIAQFQKSYKNEFSENINFPVNNIELTVSVKRAHLV